MRCGADSKHHYSASNNVTEFIKITNDANHAMNLLEKIFSDEFGVFTLSPLDPPSSVTNQMGTPGHNSKTGTRPNTQLYSPIKKAAQLYTTKVINSYQLTMNRILIFQNLDGV